NGAGNGPVTYAVEANGALSPRSGVLMIENQIFTVTQQAVACAYSLTSSNHAHIADLETNSFSIVVNTPCPWSVTNANSWVTILSGNNGVGSGSITYSVAPNYSPTQRSGVLNIADRTFTISQQGINCSYVLSLTNAHHSAASET